MKKIREVCAMAGVTKRTLQYYDDEALDRLWRILLYKRFNFKLEEIKSIIKMSEEDQKTILEKRITELNNEKEDLEQQIRFAKAICQYGIPPVFCVYKDDVITFEECLDVLNEMLDSVLLEECNDIRHVKNSLYKSGMQHKLNAEFAEWIGVELDDIDV